MLQRSPRWAANPALATQEKVDISLARCHEHGLLRSAVQVPWDFGKESVV
ncbi:hypothetical protein [Paraburkholderia hiiakae]|nr:hypothetical protein [Paraburkholderia hiiakae]